MSETNFTQFFKRLGNIVKASIPPAFKTCRWFLSLMIPISLGVTILNYTGILGWLAHFINVALIRGFYEFITGNVFAWVSRL